MCWLCHSIPCTPSDRQSPYARACANEARWRSQLGREDGVTKMTHAVSSAPDCWIVFNTDSGDISTVTEPSVPASQQNAHNVLKWEVSGWITEKGGDHDCSTVIEHEIYQSGAGGENAVPRRRQHLCSPSLTVINEGLICVALLEDDARRRRPHWRMTTV
ncbi:hypothetical protein BD311DRAFT_756327 [Dichomitus squalens]|uniref:Uncharacterized protein n=1 Tax=Dichomitus squalens TaxID=114155 RepID=A0A4Q9MT55_9APHY|nr:hypothetical protein BD311DRAFT_756327 [Dichomitus squalens]